MKILVAYVVLSVSLFGAWGFSLYNQTQELKVSVHRVGVWYGQHCR